MFVVAALLLGGGALLLTLLTTPDEIQAVAETTTTSQPLPPPTRPTIEEPELFDVGLIEVGTQLGWTRQDGFAHFYPHDLVHYGEHLYLLAAATSQWDRAPGGLSLWRSLDGRRWESLGEVIAPDHKISTVTATPQGLVAIEPGDQMMTIWRSSDGETWNPETVGVEAVDGALVYPTGVGGNDRLLVIYGHIQFEPIALLEERIEETYGLKIDLTEFGYGLNHGPEDTTFTIHGPLGLPILTTSAVEMGLTDEQQDALQHGNVGDESLVWASWDGGDWSQGQVEGLSWVNSIVSREDGSLVAIGWGQTGANIWVTYDGLTWDEERVHPEPSTIELWNDRYVGPDSIGDASILTSTDGIEWEETGVEQHLPRPLGWSIGPIAAGKKGIAAFASGWRNEAFVSEKFPEPPVLADGDLEVRIDFQSGRVTATHGDQAREIGLWGVSTPEGIEVDLAEELVIFSDVETGEAWGSFTFDELREAEEDYWPSRVGESYAVFLHSPDGTTWNVQGLEEEMDIEGPYISNLEMTATGTVVAVVISDRFSAPAGNPGFEIWTAEMP